MNTQVVPISICVGVAVGSLTYAAGRPWRRLGPRVHVYTTATRSRMGERTQLLSLSAPPPTATGVLAGVFGPIVAAVAARLNALVGHRDEAALAMALDRAGIHGVSARSYSYQQLAYAVIGVVAGAVLGQVQGTRLSVFLALAFGAVGALRKRSELDRRTEQRQDRMKAELETVCHLLAIHARATPNLQAVVATVCNRATGEVVGELRRVLAAIESGVPAGAAFTAAAEFTPEPAAARLYRALSLALSSGGDLADTLLAQAADLRDRYRDERKQRATRRTQLIVASNASLMVMPMLVLIGAGIPYLILGST